MKKSVAAIDFNPQFTVAFAAMEKTRKHIFLTGRAGTGKSTLLQHFRLHTKKKIAVLAPTGVAAVNVSGQTIHSFFHFKPDITVSKVERLPPDEAVLYVNLDTIVIDEISMVRADLLDCADTFLRLNGPDKRRPFGGVQMIFVGDLHQLPPVVTADEESIFSSHYASPYFFSAQVFSGPPQQRELFDDRLDFCLELIELKKIYRQTDRKFISLLNAIRDNAATDQDIRTLNSRCVEHEAVARDDLAMYLMTTNAMAAERNARELAQLKGTEHVYPGTVKGVFDYKALPTDMTLAVKVGAQVMMLTNDPEGRWINGTTGTVKSIKHDEEIKADLIKIELATGRTVSVGPHTWDMFEFTYDRSSQMITSDTVGSFIQYPFKLAWAITIHKAQGKTFERVVLDIGRGTFSPGQLYVALSRVTSLEGLKLTKPIQPRHIWNDRRVAEFLRALSGRARPATCLLPGKRIDSTPDSINN
ncbi:MAG: TPR domain protein [Candidatus Magasanikbacteria bacterium GW2011_GWA2_56_11]|uniref:TPR domain protein n=1 Tax=Candidatus Magasanikbacteria bacterium GW2011_GWA2_56_11 TaxID=1619044 RepID=A0A0G1YHJ1_9BACT|nr:MAG: TPR domain protein [Candidatus Magasanikbacteria bacterium GW2011_GWA2_56_11]